MNQQHLQNAKNLLFIALAIDAVLNAAIGFHDYGLLTQLREIKAGTRYYTPEFSTALTAWENASYFSILSLIGVAAALVHWLRNCYAYAENEIGCTDLEQKKYVVWGWLPILNIFKPYQVLNELFRVGGSSYSSSNGYKKESGSNGLLLWWIFWVISHLILSILNRAYINAGTKIIFNGGHTEANVLLKSAIAAYDYSVWIAVISTVVSIGWLWASNFLTERLLARQPIGIADESQPTTPNNRIMPAAATPVIARAHPTTQPTTNTEEIWANALHEFEHGQRRLGLWSKVFAEANGDEGKAKASYLKARVAEMLSDVVKDHPIEHTATSSNKVTKIQPAISNFILPTPSTQFSELSTFRRICFLLILGASVVMSLGVLPYMLITDGFNIRMVVGLGFWIAAGHYAYTAIFKK